jgi:hypothetical protein
MNQSVWVSVVQMIGSLQVRLRHLAMAALIPPLKYVTVPALSKHTATVIFIHVCATFTLEYIFLI